MGVINRVGMGVIGSGYGGGLSGSRSNRERKLYALAGLQLL